MGNLYGERKWFAINARVTYAGGRGDFVQNEIAIGTTASAPPQNRQIIVTGNGDRPVTTGDFNVTLFPGGALQHCQSTRRVSNTRMVGNNFYQQFDNSTFSFAAMNFQFLGVRLVTNATDVRYRFSKKFDVFGGFRYADRLIRSIEDSATPGFALDGVSARTIEPHQGRRGGRELDAS